MMTELGILLALLCALATNLGFLSSTAAPARRRTSTCATRCAAAPGSSGRKWFAIGMLVAVGAWLLHVAAMALAPLSLVQAVISGGLVFLTVMADRFFGCSVGARQWVGVGLTASASP